VRRSFSPKCPYALHGFATCLSKHMMQASLLSACLARKSGNPFPVPCPRAYITLHTVLFLLLACHASEPTACFPLFAHSRRLFLTRQLGSELLSVLSQAITRAPVSKYPNMVVGESELADCQSSLIKHYRDGVRSLPGLAAMAQNPLSTKTENKLVSEFLQSSPTI
jgi:hypothetical protein